MKRRDFLAGLAACALMPPVAAKATGDVAWTDFGKHPRGFRTTFYITSAYTGEVMTKDYIFDGEKFLPLTSEAGWQLYIELQREGDPDAQE